MNRNIESIHVVQRRTKEAIALQFYKPVTELLLTPAEAWEITFFIRCILRQKFASVQRPRQMSPYINFVASNRKAGIICISFHQRIAGFTAPPARWLQFVENVDLETAKLRPH